LARLLAEHLRDNAGLLHVTGRATLDVAVMSSRNDLGLVTNPFAIVVRASTIHWLGFLLDDDRVVFAACAAAHSPPKKRSVR
jgi:hypothetical protein